eukprot:scaffold2630_cov118-Isochrysis_galbana.AAC.13
MHPVCGHPKLKGGELKASQGPGGTLRGGGNGGGGKNNWRPMQTTFHTPQPNWGVAPGWPTRQPRQTTYSHPPALLGSCSRMAHPS